MGGPGTGRSATDVSARVRQMTRARSFATLGMFIIATLVSIEFPLCAFALICRVLLAYLQPEAPGAHSENGKFET